MKVADYRLEESFGSGRTGRVFRARAKGQTIWRAIRELPPGLAQDPAGIRTLRELPEQSRTLRLPTIVPVIDVVEWEGKVYVVEPWVQGQALRGRLNRAHLTPEEILGLAEDLLDALDELHGMGQVHGDISPANLFITDSGPRLVGFGVAAVLAKVLDRREIYDRAVDAPELGRSAPTHLSDIYALGATFHYALTVEERLGSLGSRSLPLASTLLRAAADSITQRFDSTEQFRRSLLGVRDQWDAEPTDPGLPAIALTDEEDSRVAQDGSVDGVGAVSLAGVSYGSVLETWDGTGLALAADDEVQRSGPQKTLDFPLEAAGELSGPVGPEGTVPPQGSRPSSVGSSSAAGYRPTSKARDSRVSSVGAADPVRDLVDALPPMAEVRRRMDSLLQERSRPLAAIAVGFFALVLAAVLWPEAPKEMVEVPRTSVRVGDAGGQGDERPGYEVVVSAILLDRHEVSWGQYQACVASGDCVSLGQEPGPRDHPVSGLNWLEAASYCTAQDKRLPTEDEWEAAARARGGIYPWGDAPPTCSLAQFGRGPDGLCREDEERQTRALDSDKTPEGELFDLAGNVWEWTDSAYQPDRVPGSGGPAAAFDGSALRVIKGGGWSSSARWLRNAARLGVPLDYRASDLGVRCAKDID